MTSCRHLCRNLIMLYEPIALSADMADTGYWRVTWSVAPGLRAAIYACRVGISRSEAIQATAEVAAALAGQVRQR